MKLDELKQAEFDELCKDILNNEDVLKMKEFCQHGHISTYDHCLKVAQDAYGLACKYKIKVDKRVLVEACLLHDFYLYDWHEASIRVPLFKMHGFTHPKKASDNAKELLNISDKACKAIESHMWPLTLNKMPMSKEAWLLCLCDKQCALKETIQRL